jgi:hypothetical protein
MATGILLILVALYVFGHIGQLRNKLMALGAGAI